MIEVTFKAFTNEFQDLKTPSCIPTCLEEICGGCNELFSIIIYPQRVPRNFQAKHTENYQERHESITIMV